MTSRVRSCRCAVRRPAKATPDAVRAPVDSGRRRCNTTTRSTARSSGQLALRAASTSSFTRSGRPRTSFRRRGYRRRSSSGGSWRRLERGLRHGLVDAAAVHRRALAVATPSPGKTATPGDRPTDRCFCFCFSRYFPFILFAQFRPSCLSVRFLSAAP